MRNPVPAEARAAILALHHQDDDVHIKLELRYNQLDEPGCLRMFQGVMAEGRVDGNSFASESYDQEGCGCFYGQRTELHSTEAYDLSEEMIRRVYPHDRRPSFSPIENLILKVVPGQTPYDCVELALLDDLINEVLAEMEQEAQGV